MERNKIKESRIDDINKRLWVNRYGDPKSITSEAQKNLSAAKKIDYAKGIAYARLILATIDFLQSKNDSASKYINEALQWFSRNKPEKGYTRAILLKGNIYESLGDYEKTLALWLEAYKISRQNEDQDSEGGIDRDLAGQPVLLDPGRRPAVEGQASGNLEARPGSNHRRASDALSQLHFSFRFRG